MKWIYIIKSVPSTMVKAPVEFGAKFDLSIDTAGYGRIEKVSFDVMGVTPEQLHADAMENAPQLKPAVITGMNEIMVEMMGREEAEMMGIPLDEEDHMFVATVPDKIHGAGVLAYENFMEEAAERVGGSFFILPSSLHEILIIPDDGNADLHELESMVREVNSTQVAPEERLSDNVYHYDAQEKVFELGEKFAERHNEKKAAMKEKTADLSYRICNGQYETNDYQDT